MTQSFVSRFGKRKPTSLYQSRELATHFETVQDLSPQSFIVALLCRGGPRYHHLAHLAARCRLLHFSLIFLRITNSTYRGIISACCRLWNGTVRQRSAAWLCVFLVELLSCGAATSNAVNAGCKCTRQSTYLTSVVASQVPRTERDLTSC